MFLPNLSEYGYTAASAETNPSEAPVKLLFTPMFSTLEFTVSAGPDAQVDVTGFRLTSGEGSKQVIAGDFNAVLAPNADLDVDIDYTNTSGEIRVSLGDHRKVRLEKGKTLTISVVTLPVKLSHLTATFTVAIRGHRVTEYTVSKPGGNNVLLPGVFTVGDKKVRFSKGNLQAVLENGVITKWQFAEHQWETACDISSLTNETGIIDLFRPSTTAPLNRWGTPIGFAEAIDPSWEQTDHMFQSEPAVQFFNDHYIGTVIPQWMNPDFVSEYGGGWEIFGGPYTSGSDNSSFYDCLMTFINTEYAQHGFFTNYYEPHCTPASIGSVNGVTLLPEDFVTPEGVSVEWPDTIVYYSGGSGVYSFEPNCTNTYTQAQWEQMEAAGAVFLPVGKYGVFTSGESVLGTSYPYLPSTTNTYQHYIGPNFLAGEPSIDGIGMIRLIQVVE